MSSMAKNDYYMMMALTASLRSNCVGLKVGAVAVLGDRIVCVGYNGTAAGLTNCLEGGCKRCSDREEFKSGQAYDLCICVHAECNVVATAARYGIALNDATLYSTHQPCFSCAKELIQVGFQKVWYATAWTPDARVEDDYYRLQSALEAAQLPVPSLESVQDGSAV